ncbi:cell surface protein [Clostridia bacterium]|nr:cell surface protein [Clostridia bacterium]GHV07055.1 cell surface protein [Clostridia bacterium]
MNRRILTALFIALIIMAFSVVAYAQSVEDTTPDPTPSVAPTPAPLTPDGNLTLVDDFTVTDDKNKQFITVTTKGGNYFYIIIDRSGDSENVHFLNMVDESDLLAIIEEQGGTVATPPPAAVTPTPIPTPTPEITPSATQEQSEPEQGNNSGVIIAVLVAAITGGGAFLYFKVLKPKSGVKGNMDVSELEVFNFEDEDEKREDEE